MWRPNKHEWQRMYAHRYLKVLNFTDVQREKLIRGCRGKILFESTAEAVETIKSMEPREGVVLGAYVCKLCGGLHIGNSKLRARLNDSALHAVEEVGTAEEEAREGAEGAAGRSGCAGTTNPHL